MNMQHRIQSLLAVIIHHLHKMSVVARGFTAVIVIFYLLSFIPNVEENLAMVPGKIVPPNVKIWTLITATFYERRIIFAALDIVAVVGFSTVLEPQWGAREYLVFSCIVGVVSLVSGLLASVFVYAVVQRLSILLVPFHGLVALACGYVVAVKQFHPDSVAFLPPAPPTLRVKHLPLAIITIASILAAVGVVSLAFVWLAFSGTAVSWVYLRFYQKKEQGGRGDMSESFAFPTFFPESIQPPLAHLGGLVYHLLVLLKVCPKTVRTYELSGPSTIKITLPGSDPVDAERRKKKALQELDKRLSKPHQPLEWPRDESNSDQDDSLSPGVKSSAVLEAVVVEKIPHPPPSETKPATSTGPPVKSASMNALPVAGSTASSSST